MSLQEQGGDTTSDAPDHARRETSTEEPERSRPAAQIPVVAVGASAGGVESFSALLNALSPELGMAYVLVPHLDRSRESVFPQILGRATRMPVIQIEDGMRVEANRVYVIPRNCDLTISNSILHTHGREESRAVNTTIDIFMCSLAADQGSNAIGIVLSGTGSDGTSGLIAIKAEGGITFAQDAQSAKYDSMPASAIAAGCVDFILPPEAIAQELARIHNHPFVSGAAPEHVESREKDSDAYLAQVFRLLRRATRVDFSEYKPQTIGRRIQRRMVLHKLDKLGDYVSYLHRDRNEVTALYQDLLINVTSFFRNPEAFETLKQIVYPAILESHGSSSSPIRIWVPGCSTGEETYSHAISLTEFLEEQRVGIPIQIFGTDLSESAIQRARAGIYKEGIEAAVGPARLRRFFHKSDGFYQISKTIRDLCIFSTQNVSSDPPFSRMDLVSCRNVMIYLGQALQKRVIPVFHYALNPAGFLMVGTTEGLLGSGSELFELADKKQKIYRKRLVSVPLHFGFSVAQPEQHTEGLQTPPSPPKRMEAPPFPAELQREADRLLLTEYAPPSVVVNEHLEIIQSRGRTGAFLELPAGKATLNLLKMARPGLLYELQSAIEEARGTRAEARRHGVRIDDNGVTKVATIRVLPFQTPAQHRFSLLVIFESAPAEKKEHPAVPSKPLTPAEESERDQQIAQLKQELAATKGYLQSIIETQEATNEELQSANEEIQSGNEELQSTNEELQTSKEELESANEELHTVNEEMQHRNEMLTQLNNDLTNLLNSINLPMVMIGSDLSVRRYTPQAAAILGLMASDVGKEIPRLKLKIDIGNLEEMLPEVIHQVHVKQYQVQDHDGKWCNLRITPFRTSDNRIDGAVLTILETDQFALPGQPATTE